MVGDYKEIEAWQIAEEMIVLVYKKEFQKSKKSKFPMLEESDV
jgi:hypothetical protein